MSGKARGGYLADSRHHGAFVRFEQVIRRNGRLERVEREGEDLVSRAEEGRKHRQWVQRMAGERDLQQPYQTSNNEYINVMHA
jgi:hypothetical protein